MGLTITMASSYGIYDRAIEAIRENLDEEAFNAAWQEGRKMTLDEAIECALGDD